MLDKNAQVGGSEQLYQLNYSFKDLKGLSSFAPVKIFLLQVSFPKSNCKVPIFLHLFLEDEEITSVAMFLCKLFVAVDRVMLEYLLSFYH